MDEAERVGCGSLSQTSNRGRCERRGCCYDNSQAGTTWCFRPSKTYCFLVVNEYILFCSFKL